MEEIVNCVKILMEETVGFGNMGVMSLLDLSSLNGLCCRENEG